MCKVCKSLVAGLAAADKASLCERGDKDNEMGPHGGSKAMRFVDESYRQIIKPDFVGQVGQTRARVQ
jgi:hypothetical protein